MNARRRSAFFRNAVLITASLFILLLVLFLIIRSSTQEFRSARSINLSYDETCCLYWGQSFRSAKKCLPAEAELSESYPESRDKGCSFAIELDGFESSMSITFSGANKRISAFSITMNVDQAELKEEYDVIVARIKESLKHHDGFWCKEIDSDRSEFGVDFGATGISYSVEIKDNCILVMGYYVF